MRRDAETDPATNPDALRAKMLIKQVSSILMLFTDMITWLNNFTIQLGLRGTFDDVATDRWTGNW